METASASDAFHLGRLRLVRLPPSWIQLPRGSRKPLAVPVELAVGLTDDYGVDLMLDSLDLQIEVLDADTLSAPIGVALQLDGASSFSSSPPKNIAFFTFNPSRGPFQTLKLFLIFSPSASTCSIPSKLSFRLSVRPRPTSSPSSSRFDGSDCSTATRRIRQILGETEQEAVETWDEKSYVLMSLTSGAVEVRSEGKEVKVAGTKVQTALRTLYLPASTPSSSEPTASLPPLPSSPSPPPAPQQITIVERPGLNNSTGQRLWDCAIGLSAFFSLVPDALDAAFPLPSLPSPPSSSDSKVASPPPAQRPCCLASPPPAKRPRTSPSLVRRGRRRVIELGAGCALASLAAQRLGGTDVEIVATDIEATVNTTLRENLEVNRQLGEGGKGEEIQSEVLNWGELSPERVAALTAGGSTSPVVSVTLIATDVLYDPDTHSLLLSTLLSFLRPSPSSSSPSPDAPLPSRRALIAYKRRTDGDDGFFARAERAGLAVRKVWDWGEVGVWAFA